MQVKQIYQLVNDAQKAVLGETSIVNEDLSNLVDIGTALFNANAVDNYVKALVDRIGKVIFVDRLYRGHAPKVLMDSWEFGSVVEKVRGDIPDATENESWKLVPGTSYDPNIFYAPKVSVKFFNSKTTFEVDLSFTTLQIKESFASVGQMNGFLSMLQNEVEKKLTVAYDSLIMRTIDAMIAETVYDDYQGGSLSTSSGAKAINLLYLYNTEKGTSLTASAAVHDKDFLTYASQQIKLYADRLGAMSEVFNVGGKKRFTPKEYLNVVMLADFESGALAYAQAPTFWKELIDLPGHQTIPFWQGSGTGWSFTDVSTIDVVTPSGHTQKVTGVIACLFDRDACGVCNVDRRTTTSFNPKAEFYTNYAKSDASYFNDLDENCIVFFLA